MEGAVTFWLRDPLQTLRNPSYYESTLAKNATATRSGVGKLTCGNLVHSSKLRGPTSEVPTRREFIHYSFKVTSSYGTLQYSPA